MKLIDFHAHPVLKPINSSLVPQELETLWKEFPEPETCKGLNFLIREAIKSTDKLSQADMSKVARGKLNGVFFAMGPAERPFFDPNVKGIVLRCLLPKKDYKKLARSVTGFCMTKIDKIFKRIEEGKGVDYFNEELVPEFNYIVAQEQITQPPFKFKIVTDYSQFKNIIDTEPNTVAVVLTVEGAHSFGNFTDADFTIDFNAVNNNAAHYKAIFLNNIKTTKQSWGDKTPFFVTLCHHFWNLLSGHSKSMSPSGPIIPGMDAMIDQNANMNTGMTEVGKEVVKALLHSDGNTRRILIDVKHMSVESRKWYYNFVRERRTAGDNIPIICSHTSVNLFDNMNDAAATEDNFYKDKFAFLSRFSINLSNDEILEIAASQGIIGIILNEGRMPGRLGRNAIKACGKEMSKQKAEMYLKLIMCNVLQIVKVVNKKEAWDLICIGSDFDGVIDPFESYMNEASLKQLPEDIANYLSNPTFDLDWIGVTALDIKNKYMFGYTAQEIAEKISYGNVMLLMERYFNSRYLQKKAIVDAGIFA